MLLFKTDQYNTASGWNISYTSSELTGISDPNNAIKFSVYPNPAKNQIALNLTSKGEECTIQIITTKGVVMYQEVLKPNIGSNIDKIDVSNLPRGLYVLKVASKNGTSIQRIVLD
jgi:hypothetical protein